MEKHESRATELFLSGMNCAQAVLLAYQEELNLDARALVRMASSMGGGVAGTRGLCGAVSSMCLAAGALLGPEDPTDKQAKTAHYALVADMIGEFEKENGSTQCRELLAKLQQAPGDAPAARTPEYYRTRPCAQLVASAARILDARLSAPQAK